MADKSIGPELESSKKYLPEYFGAKSSMLDLLPGTVIPRNPMEMVNMMMAASALHPMYPANTTVMAGTCEKANFR